MCVCERGGERERERERNRDIDREREVERERLADFPKHAGETHSDDVAGKVSGVGFMAHGSWFRV